MADAKAEASPLYGSSGSNGVHILPSRRQDYGDSFMIKKNATGIVSDKNLIAFIESIGEEGALQLLSTAVSMAIRRLSKRREANRSPLSDIIADMRFLQATKLRQYNSQTNNHIHAARFTSEQLDWFCEIRYNELVFIALSQAYAASYDSEQQEQFAAFLAFYIKVRAGEIAL